jgi:hypothetical protein
MLTLAGLDLCHREENQKPARPELRCRAAASALHDADL